METRFTRENDRPLKNEKTIVKNEKSEADKRKIEYYQHNIKSICADKNLYTSSYYTSEKIDAFMRFKEDVCDNILDMQRKAREGISSSINDIRERAVRNCDKCDKALSEVMPAVENSSAVKEKTIKKWLVSKNEILSEAIGKVLEYRKIEKMCEILEKSIRDAKSREYADRNVLYKFSSIISALSSPKGSKRTTVEVRIDAEKIQKYLYKAAEMEFPDKFKDIFKARSDIPNDIKNAQSLQKAFELINRRFSRTEAARLTDELKVLLKPDEPS